MEILDSTLREGELTADVSFSREQKLEIASLLDAFGVDIIEAGQPFVSQRLKEDTKAVASLGLNAGILGHARALTQDIDLVLQSDCNWVGIFMTTSDIGMETKYNLTKEQLIDKCLFAVDYAKSHGLKVRFTPEDGTRTDRDFLLKIIHEMKNIGVNRVSIADTTGGMNPSKMKELISFILKSVKIDLNVHCHNDLGLATANSLAAFEAGAVLSDVTVNGMGERTGITSLSELTVSLRQFYPNVGKKWNLELLPELSDRVERFSGFRIAKNTPVVGSNAFTHKAGLHTNAVLKNPASYEIIDPKTLNRERTIVVGAFAGRMSLQKKLAVMGCELSEDEFTNTFNFMKETNKRIESNSDLVKLIEESLNKNAVNICKNI